MTDKYDFNKILAEFVRNLKNVKFYVAIPVAARCKAYVCCRSLAGIAGSGPAEGILFCVLCVISYRSLRRTDLSSRGVLPTLVCLRVITKS